jgi:hypothetical protein
MTAVSMSVEDMLDPLLQLYLDRNWLIFPCAWGSSRAPLVMGGFHAASRDPGVVADWCRRWPKARWAVRTGKAPQGSDIVIIDLDRKNGKNGFETFARVTGSTEMPATARVRTPSGGGVHLYFRAPATGCLSTQDDGSRTRRGLGQGIDVKGDLNQCHVPGGASSQHCWDEEFNLLTVPLMVLPAILTPIEIPEPVDQMPSPERRAAISNVGAYAKATLGRTCDRIRSASPGRQRRVLNYESYEMGRLATALGLDHRAVVEELIEAGLGMQREGGREPWRRHDVKYQVEHAFEDGLKEPKQPQIRNRR